MTVDAVDQSFAPGAPGILEEPAPSPRRIRLPRARRPDAAVDPIGVDESTVPDPPTRRPSRSARLLHALVTAACVLVPAWLNLTLGLITVTVKPLSRDEMATWAFSRLSIPELLRATSHVDAAFLPYYTLVHLTPETTHHPQFIRVWSILAGAITVGFTVAIARQLWSRRVGVLAGLVLAVNGSFVLFEQTARSGALACMFATIATYLLVRCWRRQGAGVLVWIGYALSMGLACLCTFFALLTAVAHAVAVLVWWLHRRGVLVRFGLAVVGAVAILSPLLVSARGQRSQLQWISGRSFGDTLRLVYEFGGVPVTGEGLIGFTALVLIAATAVLTAAAVLDPQQRQRAVLALSLLVVPPLALFFGTLFLQPMQVTRYAVAVPVGAALTIAGAASVLGTVLADRLTERGWRARVGLDRLVRAAPSTVLLAVLAAAFFVQLPTLRSTDDSATMDNFPTLAANVQANLRVGDDYIAVQNYSSNGRVAGLGLYTHDAGLMLTVEQALPQGPQLVFIRKVVSTSPFRSVEVDKPSGLLLVFSDPPNNSTNFDLFGAAKLIADGCEYVAPYEPSLTLWYCTPTD